jgi:hypothetical protein
MHTIPVSIFLMIGKYRGNNNTKETADAAPHPARF